MTHTQTNWERASFWMSSRLLIRKVVEVCNKSHGIGAGAALSAGQHSILPATDFPTVDATVEFLSHFQWPEEYVCHAIESSCKAVSLRSATVHSLERFCQYVTGAAWVHLPTRCFSSLLPAVARHSTLHPFGRKLLDSMVARCIPMSPEVEVSVQVLCSEDPTELLRFVERASAGGLRPSRTLYREALKLSMDSSGQQSSPSLTSLVEWMNKDWGSAETEAIIYSAALHSSRSATQKERIWNDMMAGGVKPDEESSRHLLESYINKRTDSVQSKPDDVLRVVRQLATQRAPVSVGTFDSILMACAASKQLTPAVDTFRCMTRTYGIAPSRKGYSRLMWLLTNPLLARNPLTYPQGVALCYHILGDTVKAFGGKPPAWVYVETARPLAQRLGLHGYKQMRDFSRKAELLHTNTDNLQHAWTKEDYHLLLRASSLTQDMNFGMYVFAEMINRGIKPDETTFSRLLCFSKNQNDVIKYWNHMIFHMGDLSVEQVCALNEPLDAALHRIYGTYASSRHRKDSKVLSAAAYGVVRAALLTSHEHCIEQMKRVGHNSRTDHIRTDTNVYTTSTESTDQHLQYVNL